MVTTSTTEAELVSLDHASRELIAWNRFLDDLDIDLNPEKSNIMISFATIPRRSS